jgi:hypothetical protein
MEPRAGAKAEPKAGAKAEPKAKPKARPEAAAGPSAGVPLPQGKVRPKGKAPAAGAPAAQGKAKARAKAKGKPKAKPAAPAKAVAGPHADVVPIAQAPVRRRAEADAQMPKGPRPVRAGAPDLPKPEPRPGFESDPSLPPRPEPPSGAELVTTAIRAAGELAGIGLTLGAQAVRRAIERLPGR